MKKRLDRKEMSLISGGFLIRGKGGSYVMVGKPDPRERPEFEVDFGDDFQEAVRNDWVWFKGFYRGMGINSLKELEKHYNYGDF